MVESIRQIQKEYEHMLLAVKEEKKNTRRAIPKLDKIAEQNRNIGIVIDVTEKRFELEKQLEEQTLQITKIKKVIHRLGVCIAIMTDNEVQEEYIDNEEIEEIEE